MTKEEPMADSAGQQDALFVNLVLIFQNAAMQQMGKITNPITGKIEKNLDQARFSIDVIDMLKSKTRGNLSSDLEKLLDSTLTNLRMNYIEETSKPAEESTEPEQSKADGQAGAAGSVRTEGDTGTGSQGEGEGGKHSTAGGKPETRTGDDGGIEGEAKDGSGS